MNKNTNPEVKNIQNTSKNICRACRTWSNHWKKISSSNRTTCCAINCSGSFDVGAHVIYTDKRKQTNEWWIIPLCHGCNKKEEPFLVDSRVMFVSARSCS